MQDFRIKYSWFKVMQISSEDEEMFLEMFYLNKIPIKIKDNIVYCPFQYVETVNVIITAHYDNNLSQEYYGTFENSSKFEYRSNKNIVKRSWLKVIGPVILVIILLVFFKFLFQYGVL